MKLFKNIIWVALTLASQICIASPTIVLDVTGNLVVINPNINPNKLVVKEYATTDRNELTLTGRSISGGLTFKPCAWQNVDDCLYEIGPEGSDEHITPLIKRPIIFKGEFLYSKIANLSISEDGEIFNSPGHFHPISPLRNVRDLKVVDLDNDSVPDLLFNEYSASGCLHVYKSSSSAYIKKSPSKLTDCYGHYGENIAYVDIDNNGFLDFFATAYEKNTFFLNYGNFNFIEKTPADLVLVNGKPRVEGSIIADIDGSGVFKILVRDKICDFQNRCLTSLPSEYSDADEGIALADFDNSGSTFIVKNNTNFGRIDIFQYKDSSVKYIKSLKPYAAFGVKSVFGLDIADVNSDGCSDIIIAGGVGNGGGPIIYFGDCSINFTEVRLHGFPFMHSGPIVASGDNASGRINIYNRVYRDSVIYNSNIDNEDFFSKSAAEKSAVVKYNVSGAELPNLILKPSNLPFQYGRMLRIRGKNGFVRNEWVPNGSGFLSQKQSQLFLALPWEGCPYTVEVVGSKGMPKEFKCLQRVPQKL